MPSEYIAKVGGAVCKCSDDLLIEGVRSKSRLPKNSRSVITFAFPYWVGEREGRNLSLYAMLPDYHDVVMKRLEGYADKLRSLCPDNEFECFCDASPVNEVRAAARAGLGSLGQNGLIITRDYGALIFIGEIVTDLEIEADGGISPCDGCQKCIKACPTGALSEKGFCRSLCRSHISQKKGILSESEENSLKDGKLAWGCDCCVMACPYSKASKLTSIDEFLNDVEPVLSYENMDRLIKNRAFSWRGKAVLERNLRLTEGETKQ